MRIDQIRTPEDLEYYIDDNMDTIFVREQINGKWGSYSLRELPEELAKKHIMRFLSEGRLPVIVLEN